MNKVVNKKDLEGNEELLGMAEELKKKYESAKKDGSKETSQILLDLGSVNEIQSKLSKEFKGDNGIDNAINYINEIHTGVLKLVATGYLSRENAAGINDILLKCKNALYEKIK